MPNSYSRPTGLLQNEILLYEILNKLRRITKISGGTVTTTSTTTIP